MDKLRAMQSFTRIVERGSLTAAAESLRVSLPSMVRSLAALEAGLGVRLINRTTRRMALTNEGREYYDCCKRVLAEVEHAESELTARHAAPRGRLRVTASVMLGSMHVAPVLNAFAARHPAVNAELLLVDQPLDLVAEGIDLAVRIGRLPDSALVAIPVGIARRMLCASPAYLRRSGTPSSPEELGAHRCVASSGAARAYQWHLGAGKQARPVKVRPAFTSNQIGAAIDAATSGLGIGQFLDYQVQALVASGRLKRILVDFEPPPQPINVVHTHARLPSPNVRAFIDWAVPRLRSRLTQR
jgi:DNA-binding transcriptional LysR family regulator